MVNLLGKASYYTTFEMATYLGSCFSINLTSCAWTLTASTLSSRIGRDCNQVSAKLLLCSAMSGWNSMILPKAETAFSVAEALSSDLSSESASLVNSPLNLVVFSQASICKCEARVEERYGQIPKAIISCTLQPINRSTVHRERLS